MIAHSHEAQEHLSYSHDGIFYGITTCRIFVVNSSFHSDPTSNVITMVLKYEKSCQKTQTFYIFLRLISTISFGIVTIHQLLEVSINYYQPNRTVFHTHDLVLLYIPFTPLNALREHMSSPLVSLIFLVLCVVLLCVFLF